MHVIVPVDVNQYDYLAIQDSERHQTCFAIVFPRILARNGEVVPNGVGSLEIQAVPLNIPAAL